VESGVVTGVAAGEADITARYQNVTGRLRITVSGTSCAFSVFPTTVSIPAAGGTATVNVSTAANCSWTAASSASFVTITPGASGNGNGATAITVSANAGDARSAVLTVAGRQVTVSQAAGNCVTAVSPPSADYSAELKRGNGDRYGIAGLPVDRGHHVHVHQPQQLRRVWHQ